MKAIAHTQACPITADNALIELTIDKPQPAAHDLLVRVHGISLNPVDVKVRENMAPEGAHRILGYDAAGIVEAVGSEVTHFKPGDEVFYAGEFMRPGSNAEYQLVDERLTGRKPSSLGFADAAAVPLTAITAWEILFDAFKLNEGDGMGEALLVIGGAGGVGSILIQLAKKLTNLTVIATASRPDTIEWVKKMGADHVVNHRNPLNEELKALEIQPRYVAALTGTDQHWDAIIELIKPRGHIAMTDDPQDLNINAIKLKALTLTWEFMFARSIFQTEDMDVQHTLLNRVSELLDNNSLITTANHHGGEMNVKNLLAAHEFQESGRAIGKSVLDGFK
ncbi:zinc-binding alcohol dehydrogenase family protein [Granulosicoccus antarcticus]|uniref:Zinc-type alcohol dehydrogenase-like protein n=1 Tax=Granulosicoccus antarcticus IMCC3135 TaxID=1192854 RepID=A0A2Z2NRL9_9GAMM|nr:zinc-binding alcohol dehydrogenase family protein [Granulosicoccus antarcticus]ASJ74003.1 Zinc-type alcohol dehydrogenase-like protein [Granulosicoccus antarcticus IMCC3135]